MQQDLVRSSRKNDILEKSKIEERKKLKAITDRKMEPRVTISLISLIHENHITSSWYRHLNHYDTTNRQLLCVVDFS